MIDLMTIANRERQLTKILERIFTRDKTAGLWLLRECLRRKSMDAGQALQELTFQAFHSPRGRRQPWNGKCREDDLCIKARGSALGRICGLGEIKIDAEFGYNQAADYSKRAAWVVKLGECAWAFTLLIAPRDYLRHPLATTFDVRISLEEIADELPKWATVSAQDAEFIQAACTHVYVQVPDPVNSAFWAEYAALQLREFLELTITNYPTDGRGKGKEAIDVYFAGAAHGWPIKHSLQNGTVMIELLQRRHLEQSIKKLLAPTFAADWELVRPRSGRLQPDGSRGTSLHIVTSAPHVWPQKTFAPQIPNIVIGLRKVQAFYQWEQSHATELDRLNDL
jgi:hypothetical protein